MPFSKSTLEFLLENRARNDRDWFAENKPRYQEVVLTPLADFVTAVAPTMLDIDSEIICAPKVGKCISRIYRDTRFSKDKSLYRDVMWCTFMRSHDGKRGLFYGLPCFYFEISQQGFRYGMGYYQAEKHSLDAIRSMIVSGSKYYKAARSAYDAQDTFSLYGDMYKRSKFPDSPAPERDWLDRKNLEFSHVSADFDKLFSEDLVAEVIRGFKMLTPMYEFFMTAETL